MRADALRDDADEADTPDAGVSAASQTVLTFKLGPRTFAVNVTSVREILDPCEILPLPNPPPDVLGLIDLRGESIPIVDLAARLRMSPEPGPETRIIVFEIPSETRHRCAGVVADHVLRVVDVSPEDLETKADALPDWAGPGLTDLFRSQDGVALMLDVTAFLDIGGASNAFVL